METLDKDSIPKYILSHLQVGNFGKSLYDDFTIEIVSAILHRLPKNNEMTGDSITKYLH